MNDYLDGLRDQLVAASQRMSAAAAPVAQHRGGWRRSPRILAITLAVLSVSATALATTAPWQPLFGSSGSPQPNVTGAAPPAQLMNMLSVLRRAQTDKDRGPTTRAALQYFGASTQAIYTDYIRFLPSDTAGLQAILVPAQAWNVGRFVKPDVVCLFIVEPDPGAGGGKLCSTSTEIESGLAAGSLGPVAYGLVPDGVGRVVLHYRSGTTATASVHDNFYELHAPSGAVAGGGTIADLPSSVEWLTTDGSQSPTQPSPSVASPAVVPPPVIPQGHSKRP